MIDYIDIFLGALISIYLYIYIIKKVFTRKLNFNIYLLILITIAISVINLYNKDIFKLYFTLPILIIYFTVAMKTKIEKSFFFVLVATLYVFIGEIFTGLLFVFVPHDYTFIFLNVMGRTTGSLLVFIFSIPSIKLKFISNFFKSLEEKLNIKKIISIGGIIITIIGAISYKNTHSIDNFTSYIMNISLYVMALLLIFLYLKEMHNKRDIELEYINLIKYLEKYEKEIEEKRKIVHDFNNQIIVINGYVEEDNIVLKNYLNEIIKDQRNNKSNIFIDGLINIPIGLKGLIYYKFVSVYEKINLQIEAKNMKKYKDISPKLNKDILKIVGILIDNAIEAVSEIDEKLIFLSMTIKNNILDISISNSVKEDVDISLINKQGYSTKGKKRGYGISIINDILNENKDIKLTFSNLKGIFESNIKAKI